MSQPDLLPRVPSLPRLPPGEDPASRLMEGSADYLSDSELLSLILARNLSPRDALDTARTLLTEAGGLHRLHGFSVDELTRIPGIGRRTACAIRSALALSTRLQRPEPGSRPKLESPRDVARCFRSHFSGKQQEEFHVLLLDTKNHLIRDELVTVGLVDRSQVHAREVFREAIRRTCSRVILLHNHPSGDPTPSAQDVACTRSLVAAGRIVDIEVIDHVILGRATPSRPRDYLSFREESLLK